jgi:demethylmenaquinone methyltransferase/2-methoxy-6-polyprenyl-1,4-benzoquinol methylase
MGLLEVAEPKSRIVRLGHSIYFRKVVPWVGGLLSDKAAYSYLPRSTAYLPPTPELLAMIEAAGFSDGYAKQVGLGAAQILLGTRS